VLISPDGYQRWISKGLGMLSSPEK